MNDDLRLHEHLIGNPGSRRQINTPALVLDLDTLDRNIAAMAQLAQQYGVSLRPHAKTHKSVDIARRQIEAGAVGICCTKLGEAEALAEGGITNILLTSPVVTAPGLARLASLAAKVPGLGVVIDHPDNAGALGQAMKRAGATLDAFIDIDPGMHRTGVRSVDDALELAGAITAQNALRYRGVQFYCGVHQHIETYDERRQAIRERTAYLQTFLTALGQAGFAAEIVTGSGTGTHRIDLEIGTMTELQAGSYIFMDREYNDCELTDGNSPPPETSLFIDTTVVSANGPGIATVDAGMKAMATDAGEPPIITGAAKGATYQFMGDEHGLILGPDEASTMQTGARLSLAVPHCDPTVNLYDSYHVVRGDTLLHIWPVSARGRSR
ncbi:DSD1 family PLP-dependent enzyme [Pacificimonas sp. ICDLI1SI03]